ncbi:hypothetical protein ES703_95508 [subsurface metagenome]
MTRIVIGNLKRHFLNWLKPTLFYQAVKVFGDMQYLKIQLLANSRIVELKSPIAIGTRGYHRAHTRGIPGFYIVLGIFGKLSAIAYLEGPASTACLLLPLNANINTCYLQKSYCVSGNFP